MKETHKSLAIFTFISLLLGSLLFVDIIPSLDSEVSSSNGDLKVYIHFNSSEGGLTPYGYETYLMKWYSPKVFASDSSMFFSGHCGSEGPIIEWLDARTLKLECKHPQYIALKKSKIGDIRIEYVMGEIDVL